MKYAIKVNEVKKENGNVKGFVTVVFADSFKITNIAIVENKDKGQLFVSMPRYKSNERSEDGSAIYKDVCNPITAEFREELYSNILEEYERVQVQGQPEKGTEKDVTPPEFSVTVTPYEREGSNIRGLARIYFEDSFIVNNVNILQGKEKVYSDRFIRIQQIDKILTGYGFTSNQQFTDYVINNTAGIFPVEDTPRDSVSGDSIHP